MAHVNIDVYFTERPGIAALSNAAFRLHISALLWCKAQDRQAISLSAVKFLRRRDHVRASAVHELLQHNVWFVDPDGYLPSGLHKPRGESRPAIPLGLRIEVLARDGHACQVCGAEDRLTLDHIVPYSQGGPDTAENLRTLCRRCNARRGAALRTDDELRGTA